MIRSLLLCMIALAAATVLAATPVYKWRDVNGVHYSDTPPPQGATIIQVNSHSARPQAIEADTARPRHAPDNRPRQQQDQQKATRTEAVRDARCREGKRELEKLKGARRVRQIGAHGKTTFYSGKKLVKLKRDVRDRTDKYCK